MKKLTFLGAALLLCGSSMTMAAGEKIDVCHQSASGNLVVLNIPQTAANSHIQEHFDYLPFTQYEDLDGDGIGNPDIYFLSCEEDVDGYSLVKATDTVVEPY